MRSPANRTRRGSSTRGSGGFAPGRQKRTSMRKHSGSRCSSSWIKASLSAAALLALPGCKKESLPPAPAPPALRFADRAAEAGLDHVWTIPGKRPLNILQTIGNGCAFIDFDADGALDILLVGSPSRLYRGDG